MKTNTPKKNRNSYQPNRTLGVYILSITCFVAAYTLITVAQYL